MAIVWLDIWDIQSGYNAKMLINRCFNVGNYIVTIWGANMNPSVPQCKNWGHTTLSCRIQDAKCVKCNGPHKSDHHREFGWCCKANTKINHQDWKPRRVNHAPTHSNVLTAGATTKPTPTSVHFGDTDSIGNGTRKSMPRSMKTDQNQFVLK